MSRRAGAPIDAPWPVVMGVQSMRVLIFPALMMSATACTYTATPGDSHRISATATPSIAAPEAPKGRWDYRWVPDPEDHRFSYAGAGYNDGLDWMDRHATTGVTTIILHTEPVVTTTTHTEYVTEYVRAPVRRAAPKRVKPHPAKRPACPCRLVCC